MSTPAGYLPQQRNPRAQNFTDMVFQPGIASNDVARQLKGRWIASNRIRWHKGNAEKIGGWEPVALGGANNGVYVGTVRAVIDWASLDGQYWIAFATELKLYLINNSTLYDITPIRHTSNTKNAFSTLNGQFLVHVTDPNSFVNAGDHISIVGPIVVGGISLNGDYTVDSITDSNSYWIRAATNANATVNLGGGPVTITYDIAGGQAGNGQLLGYGTGPYGGGPYGTQRTVGISSRLRTWSLANWGQDLVASYSNGEIFWWQWGNGPSVRAQIITNAPTSVQRLIVDANEQVLIAVGASTVAGNADAMNIRWCSIGNLQDWLPVVLPVANTAGGQRLNYGSRMIAAVNSRQQILLWSDTQLYQMQFNGTSNLYGFNPLGKCLLVGPNAAVDVNGVVFMMCYDDFYVYDGTLRVLECDMWETVFGDAGQGVQTGAGEAILDSATGNLAILTDSGAQLTTDTGGNPGFDRTQAEMVYAASYSTKNEVTWYFPSEVGQVMQYVTYNWDLQCWYGGTMPRTAMRDVTPAIANYVKYPFGFNNGTLYQHEIGYDEVEPGGITNPMYYFLQSWDIGQQSDRPMLINSLIPDFSRLRNGCQFSYLTKEHPRDAAYRQVGPFIITPDTTRVDERAGGTQVSLLIEAASVNGAVVPGQDFRMGTWQAQAGPHGKRMAGASRGSAINTNNP